MGGAHQWSSGVGQAEKGSWMWILVDTSMEASRTGGNLREGGEPEAH